MHTMRMVLIKTIKKKLHYFSFLVYLHSFQYDIVWLLGFVVLPRSISFMKYLECVRHLLLFVGISLILKPEICRLRRDG
ncbi:hypothetical protein L2E82_20426 [Cichorium intybus]|uniref:Uncharacterized protein n=1 Tax=Cichorium intybus TaxID=13427 RepID=A0ACB9DTN5_CICIN|nr:hypothetical protein L2E82_20426 [Cichorium intybus]